MTDPAPPSDAGEPHLPPDRPPLAWRVGVTGHRDIPVTLTGGVRDAVAAVLACLRETMEGLAADPAVAAVHAVAPVPLLRLVSPLADGADRLVAEEALAQGWRLEAVLPFPLEMYEQDFETASLGAFRDLLARAGEGNVTALDGAQGGTRQRSYEAVGRYVVRNCDLLIAIWDVAHASRRGGTEDTVQAALAAGVPVWWIDPARPDAARLLGRDDATAPEGPALATLAASVRLAILPPVVDPPHAHGLIDPAVRSLWHRRGSASTPLHDFLAEGQPGAPRLRGLYTRFMAFVVGQSNGTPRPVAAPQGDAERWWQRNHATAAALSKVHGDRHRSSYVAAFLLAGLALLAAIAAFVMPAALHVPVVLLEVVTLTGILAIVAANHVCRWQERWITYRLLAELCRKQGMLAPLGWTLPVRDITRILDGPRERAEYGSPPADAWVAWYFAAMRRAAPLPGRPLTPATLGAAREAARAVLEQQLTYHLLRQARSAAASRRLARWGEGFFLLALAGAAVRVMLELLHAPAALITAIGLGCALSPAASATLLGIRAYAEFDLLARQSERMRQVMAEASRDLDAVDLDVPLASDELGSVLLGASAAMLLDIDGWAQLFHVKALEAG